MAGASQGRIYYTGSYVVTALFALLLCWWIYIQFFIQASSEVLQLWGASYQIIAWIGALGGFFIATQWGGFRSLVGRAILAFSAGLFLQCLAQTVYSAYVYFLQIPIPYPSLGDVGFFGSIPCYAYGAFLLARVSGVKVSLQSYRHQAIALLLPLSLLLFSYIFFLRDYSFDWSAPLTIFLDFAYPLGQAGYVSIAILAFLLTRNTLGGRMRAPILSFIAALVTQYFSDFTFLYEAHQGSYYSGSYNDVIYAASYLLMTLSLFRIGSAYFTIRTTYSETVVSGVLQGAASVFSQIALLIIREQSQVIGPLAWSEAQKVSGISIDMAANQVLVSTDDSKGTVDRLVAQYERLFGSASRQVCRDAAARIVGGLPVSDVPTSLLV